jgi:plastocyanin
MDRLRTTRLLVVAGIGALAALSGCADDGNAANANIVDLTATETTGAERAQPFQIEIKNYQFVPADAVVPAGTEVVWVNEDADVHSILSTGDLFQSSDNFNQGESYSVVIPDAGTYDYTCGVHPFMMGTITVQG